MIKKSFPITLSLAAITKAVSIRTVSTQATGHSLSESMLMQVSTDVCVDHPMAYCDELNPLLEQNPNDYWAICAPGYPHSETGQVNLTMCCGCLTTGLAELASDPPTQS